jgi:DNA-binding CsgD family transcriptional regulator
MSSVSPIESSSLSDVPVSLSLELYIEHPKAGEMALLALSHTAIEQRLYEVMQIQTLSLGRTHDTFSVRRLLVLSGLRSYGSVRRGCAGLVRKLSVEALVGDDIQRGCLYRVFSPEQIFARRQAAGLDPYPSYLRDYENNRVLGLLMRNVVGRQDLSRREGLVVLCCAEGLSNAEIGGRLGISEQTVKSHLRQIFVKCGVKRRAELVSLILMQSTSKKRIGTTKGRVRESDLVGMPTPA